MTLQKLIEKMREEAKNGVLSDFESEDVKKLCAASEMMRDKLDQVKRTMRIHKWDCIANSCESVLAKADQICAKIEGK